VGQQLKGDGMAEQPQEPSSRELLDRITKLEAENATLTAQVGDLKRWAAKSDECFIRQAKQVGAILESLGLIELRLINITAKIFPGTIQTEQQIAEIIDPAERAWRQGKDQRD
jgi:hypothetical protein